MNYLKLNFKKKIPFCILIYINFFIFILKIMKKIGLIRKFIICTNFKKKKFKFIKIFFTLNFFFSPFIDFFSYLSKIFYFSLHAIKLINYKLFNSNLIISSSKGLLTHHDIIKKKIGGKLLMLIII